MLVRFALSFLCVAISAGGTAIGSGTIDQARLRRHIEILSSDSFSGREAGGPAEEKTINYIIRAFAAAGLKPAMPDGNWLQPVPLVRRSVMDWRLSMKAQNGRSAALPSASLAMIGNDMRARFTDAPLVYVGFGVVDARIGRNDLAGVDLRGAVVLRQAGVAPEYAKTGIAPLGFAERRRLYHDLGAIAEIAISDADDRQFRLLQAGYQNGLIQLDEKSASLSITGQMRNAAARNMIASSGRSLDDLKASASSPGFKPVTLNVRLSGQTETRINRFKSSNVVGRIEGRIWPDEAVLLTAHWDGYGICRPRNAPDRICNGAIDNASGIAGLIELADHLRRGEAPARSIIFIATTAEEHGLLGAEYYARQPVVPLTDTIGGINIDTIALRGRGAKLAIIGKGLTSLDVIIKKKVEEQGRQILDDPAVQSYYSRSDHFVFARRGVPMVMLTGLFSREKEKGDAVDIFFDRHYHQPGDELGAIPSFDGAAEDLDVVLKVVREMTESAERPEWTANSPYQRIQSR